MSGDYSRERFDADADVSGVRMQQGRVQLDSDWNEWVSVVDRRFRAETTDLVGLEPDPDFQGVAVYPRNTPDAFAITTAAGAITIGRGRMYVDGLLAENHGGGALEFDRVLDEQRGVAGLPYTVQPYFPNPPVLPTSGRALAYLDVWQREVTALQDPGLVEQAIGVDTTAHMQTVWQVRVLTGIGPNVTCDTPDGEIAGWNDLNRASAGRLTTAAVGVPPEEDPCEMPPSGGYRGVENQLYRVEIHDGGAVGAATFKWSRDNGSVASAVVEVISAHELRLASLGRDSVLRFNTGDWVEIIDDHRELSGIDADPARRHGEIRQIVTDEATRTITFSPDLPADLLPGGVDDDTVDGRHLLVRRWDQTGSVYDADGEEYFDLDAPAGSAGVIPVPAGGTTLMLESGIQVTFSLAAAGGTFRSGDYWTFAARTTDASVEILDAAPPRGTHHHFARLAVVTFPSEALDCRRAWPPAIPTGGDGCGGCCTICISAEQFAANPNVIQEAVDSLRTSGGTICLGVGAFVLGERRVRIEGARALTIRGHGAATQVIGWAALFEVRTSMLVAIEDLAMIQMRGSGQPVLALDQVLYGRYERLHISRTGGEDNAEDSPPAIGLSRIVAYIDIKESVITAAVGIATWFGGNREGQYLLSDGLQIDDNLFTTAERGIHLQGQVLFGGDVRVARNRFAGCDTAAVTLVGASVPATRVEVTDNVINASGVGILAGVNGLRIDRNELSAPEEGGTQAQIGIALLPGFERLPIGPVSITGNHLRGMTGPAIAVATPVTTADIQDNIIRGTGGGIIFAGAGAGDTVSLAGNEISDLLSDERQSTLASAIRVQRVREATVRSNTIRNLSGGVTGGLIAAVLAVGCLDVVITGNHISAIRATAERATAVAIMVAQPFGNAAVSDNIVRGEPDEANRAEQWSGIMIGATEPDDVRRVGEGLTSVRVSANRSVLITDGFAASFEIESTNAAVHGNLVDGGGVMPGIIVGVQGECLFGDNRCDYAGSRLPAVWLTARLAAVSSNRVRGGEIAMRLDVDPRASTVVGNITSSAITMGGPLVSPWNVLNTVA